MTQESTGISAQALMHHSYLLGLQLMIATNKDAEIAGDWMFRLFRRQHQEKFLSSFEKLGLAGMSDAVACAKYHVMSNSIGGVPVEYIYENERKAWVRFRYPRWMYAGPTICGISVEVSRGFLQGWYAHNGVTLRNPRLGFVCVSEDMTGEFGFCGYFKEYEFDLDDGQRLQFSKDERPPPFELQDQPQLLSHEWSAARLQKANRNYAIDYIRNGIAELAKLIGAKETQRLAGKAAKLIGLQYLSETRKLLGLDDADANSACLYLTKMFEGMGDSVEIQSRPGSREIELHQHGLRIVKDLEDEERKLILDCWVQLWVGALSSYRVLKQARVEVFANHIVWKFFDVER